MTPEHIKNVFFWMMIINLGLYLYSTLVFMFAVDWAFRLIKNWFKLPVEVETIRILVFGYLGFYKILILFFCVVPYLALLIVF